jgi:putative peptidoglycan lipid II flippase
MGLFFNYLMVFFENNLSYEENFKSVYIILSVLLGLVSYLLISILIKAFKISDINLKY